MTVIFSRLATLASLAMLAALSGCATPKGGSPAEKRADAQRMRGEVLGTFYQAMPQMRAQIENAPGYGVFSGVGTQTIILASGNGFGIIRDNATGQDTYMRAIKLGGGLGVGAESVRAVVVSSAQLAVGVGVGDGVGVTGSAAAAAKVGDSGGSGAVVVTLPGMSIYRFTETGAMLGGAVQGVKIWPDEELN